MDETVASDPEPTIRAVADGPSWSRPYVGLAVAPAVAISIFILDTLSPLQFAVAVLYVVVIVIAATYFDRQGVLITASTCCVLTVCSYSIAHGIRLEGTAPLRLIVSLAAIGITTFLVLANLSANANLRVSERRRANLSRFFSPAIIDQLTETDVPLSVARYQPAVVMFVDMVGFTAFSSRLKPEAVITMLRELLGLLSKAVFANRGTIDKFLGDGLMAVFGSPECGPLDATNAARCALDILHSVDRWNGERCRVGQTEIRLAIGIHSGDVVFGDVGGETRLELTVLGDTVNIASRVETYCRSLDADVLVTAAFMDMLREEGGYGVARNFLDLGWHALRGHIEPIRLYGIRRRGVKMPHSRTVTGADGM